MAEVQGATFVRERRRSLRSKVTRSLRTLELKEGKRFL